MENSKYIGTYKLDVPNSKLGKYENIDSLLDLKLEIKKDRTFWFSKNVPFIFQRAGTWKAKEVTSIDNPPVNECYFIYNSHDREDVLLPMDEEYDHVYFNYPMAQGNYENQVALLCFRRMPTE